MVQEADITYSPHLPSWKYLYSQGTALAEQNTVPVIILSVCYHQAGCLVHQEVQDKNVCVKYTSAAPKAMSHILLCWPTMSEVDVGGMVAEDEFYCQYSITFCSCVMDDSREAV